VGDVIYALPALLSLVSQRHIDEVTFYLQLNQAVQYSGWHPLGNLLLDKAYFEKLRPLLLTLPCIRRVEVYAGEPVDVDFDGFRRLPFNYGTYCIPRWYFLFVIGTNWDLSRPWLTVEPDFRFKDFALVGRNPRLQSSFIRYDFLNRYADEVVFVGVPQEFEQFRAQCPSCKHFYQASDFLELARVLAGCRFYVGNQGLVYTLAEALKVPRLLETNTRAANNIPEGGECFDALFQAGFEYWFAHLMQRPRSTS
jgi:hypothetical protein